MRNIKPCPFCGEQAKTVHEFGNEVRPQSWTTGCFTCGVAFHHYGSSSWAVNSKEDAAAELSTVERWNRRAS